MTFTLQAPAGDLVAGDTSLRRCRTTPPPSTRPPSSPRAAPPTPRRSRARRTPPATPWSPPARGPSPPLGLRRRLLPAAPSGASAAVRPAVAARPTDTRVELGVKFRADVDGIVSGHPLLQGHRQHRHPRRQPVDTAGGPCWPRPPSAPRPPSGWQQVAFASPVAVDRRHDLRRLVPRPQRPLRRRPRLLHHRGVDTPPLHALADGIDGANGVYRYGTSAGVPRASTWQSAQLLGRRRLRDASRRDTTAADVTDRHARRRAPPACAVATAATATFSEAVHRQPTLRAAPAPPATVAAGAAAYDAGARTATFTPTASSPRQTTYTATVTGATTPPATRWRAAHVVVHHRGRHRPGGCPCTIWPAIDDTGHGRRSRLTPRRRARREVPHRRRRATSPASASTRATATPAPTSAACGPATGTLLATATFTAEIGHAAGSRSPSATPSPVTANTTYVASYYTPVGRYAVDIELLRHRRRRQPTAPRPAQTASTAATASTATAPAPASPTTTYQATQLLGRRGVFTSTAQTTTTTVPGPATPRAPAVGTQCAAARCGRLRPHLPRPPRLTPTPSSSA